MKAAVLYGQQDVRVEEISSSPLKTGEVRIRIEAALTCGTDLKVFKRGYHARMIVPPAVFGHELSGVLQELAPGVSGWRAGDRVVVANSAPCGECAACLRHQENLCDDLLFLNGAYAEEIVVPARIVQKNMLRIPDSVSFRDAALVEPLACVVQGIEDSEVQTGQKVLVLGAGPIGLMFVALSHHLGCDVTVIGRRESRLEAARRLGAGRVIDLPSEGDPVKLGLGLVPHGFDVVLEAVGKPEAWEAAVRLVRKGGTVNFFGGCPAGTTITLDTTLIHYSNLTLLASFHHTPRTIRRALGFIESGVISSKDFVDGESSLSRLPELLRSMAAGNRAVKTFVDVKS